MKILNRNEVIAARNLLYIGAAVYFWLTSSPDFTQPGLHHLFPLWAQVTETMLKWSALLLLHRLFVHHVWNPLTARSFSPM